MLLSCFEGPFPHLLPSVYSASSFLLVLLNYRLYKIRPSAGGSLLPYRESTESRLATANQPLTMHFCTQRSHICGRNPFRLFEEAWGGLGGNRRKSEALMCSLEVEEAPECRRQLQMTSRFAAGAVPAGDLVMNTQSPRIFCQITLETNQSFQTLRKHFPSLCSYCRLPLHSGEINTNSNRSSW